MRKRLLWTGGALALVASVILISRSLDGAALAAVLREAVSDPGTLVALAFYSGAFLLRARLWSDLVPKLSFGHSLAAIHVSLAGNHVLPLRLGEALRVTSVVRRTDVDLPTAAVSTLTLRASDVLAVVALAAALGPRLIGEMVGPWGWAVVAGAAVAWVAGLVWMKKSRMFRHMRVSISKVGVASVAAWILESAVIWQAARWAGLQISVQEAILITAVTIAAQTLALAPGGIGTYEAAATASFLALGFDAGPALAAAVGAHALKTIYALVTGGLALFNPSPSAFGRLRLPPAPAPDITQPRPEPSVDAPVVFFMPAHNEAASIAPVIERVPTSVEGRRVECIVIDDGSTDRTAEIARCAGAEVISLPTNLGLGAAVRRGLQEATERGAAAVAFCDADGEYAPEELALLVAPILEGHSDYVVGSRFSGTIHRMLPHRRLGNKVLTRMLRLVARRPITDGQTGYRAFSASAAADAEVIHDFNYAQVLTLDLLAKGYRYREVPITYSFRTTGRSFVRLGSYLREVIPAIHRELNAPTSFTATSSG